MQISDLLSRINFSNLSDCELISILESLEDAIYVTGKNTELIYMNKAAEDLFGFKLCDMVGKLNHEINDNFKYWYPTVIIDAYKEKKKYTQEQWSTHNGKNFHTTLIPIFDKSGEVCMVTSLSRIKTYDVASSVQNFGGFSSKSPAMIDLLHQVKKICTLNSTILLTGETGTGKNMLARHIHESSTRKDKPFIMVNCSTIATNIIETELFGYEPYTFSGANPKGKKGIIESAEGGTIFLDEIDELSLKVQPKILEFLQNGTYRKVGGRETIKSDVRIIAASNKNLLEECTAKRFRHDLYYRLSIFELNLPPLRERVLDIKDLSNCFLDYNNKVYKTNRKLAEESYTLLENYSWPGNVRQLKNFFEKITIALDSDIIYPYHISFANTAVQKPENIPKAPKNTDIEIISFDEKMKDLEKSLIVEAYKKHKSCRNVAKALSLSTTKAHRLISLYCADYKV